MLKMMFCQQKDLKRQLYLGTGMNWVNLGYINLSFKFVMMSAIDYVSSMHENVL